MAVIPAHISRSRLAIGLLLVATGLVANPILLGALLSDDGRIGTTLFRDVIWAGDLVLVVLGALLAFVPQFRVPRLLVNLSITAATLVFCVAAVEGALRLLTSHEADDALSREWFIPNPHGTGSYRIRPNATLRAQIGNTRVDMRSNSFGMVWREVELEKPLGRKRIALLGDSFTAGEWVDRIEHSFAGIFETCLADSSVEVLDFGVGGYGFFDMKLQFTEEVLRFRPDYVILVSFNGNDFQDTYLADRRNLLDRDITRADPATDTVIPREVAPLREMPGPVAKLLADFRIYQLIHATIRTRAAERKRPNAAFRASTRLGDPTFWSQKPYSEFATRATRQSLKVLDELRTAVEASGAGFMIVALPFEQQVYASQPSGSGYDIAYPQKHLQDYALQHGVPYLDLLPALRDSARARSDRLYWSTDPHLNEHGHSVVGHLLDRFVRQDSTVTKSGRGCA